MMRSPEQQYNFAKSLPIPALEKVLEGQSDVVEPYVADMVLRQKTAALVAEKGAQAMQMAQSPKIVQKDLAAARQVMQPRMEQGIASMPVGGIGKIGNMNGAGGGIVAFDDGGPVQHFQNQGLVKGNQLSLFPELAAEAAESRRVSFANALKKMFGLRGMGAFGAATAPTYYLVDEGLNYDTGIGFGTPEEQMTIGTIPPSPRVRPVDRVRTAAPAAPAAPATTTPPSPPPRVSPSDSDKEEVGLTSLIDKFYGPAKEAKSLQDITKERLDLYRQLGIEADPYAKARENLEKDRATDKEARREAGWMRLLEAGLGTLGGESPYGFVNLGKGSQAAAKGAAEDMKEFRKLERDRKKAEADYAIATNAYKKSGADADLAAVDRERTRVEAANMKRADAGLTVAVEQVKLKAQREGRLQERDLKLYLGAIEQASAILKNNFDVSSMSLDEIQRQVNAQAARIYNQYKEGGFGASANTPQGNIIKDPKTGKLRYKLPGE